MYWFDLLAQSGDVPAVPVPPVGSDWTPAAVCSVITLVVTLLVTQLGPMLLKLIQARGKNAQVLQRLASDGYERVILRLENSMEKLQGKFDALELKNDEMCERNDTLQDQYDALQKQHASCEKKQKEQDELIEKLMAKVKVVEAAQNSTA